MNERLAQIQAEKQTLSWHNPEHHERLMELEEEEQQIEAKQRIDGLMDAVMTLGLFRAIVPAPAEGERLYEYEQREKEFNLITYDFAKEQLQQSDEVHNAELEKKNEKIRELLKQLAEFENKYTETKTHLNEALQRNVEVVEDYNKAVSERDELQEKLAEEKQEHQDGIDLLNKTKQQTYELIAKVAELEQKLDQSQKPKEAHQPSEELSERVKKLADSTIKSSRELALDGLTFRGKVEWSLPPIVQPVPPEAERLQFRNEQDSPSGDPNPAVADQQAGGIPADHSEVDFQSEVSVADGEPSGAVEDTPVTRAEFEALKARVEKLEAISK